MAIYIMILYRLCVRREQVLSTIISTIYYSHIKVVGVGCVCIQGLVCNLNSCSIIYQSPDIHC